MSNISVLIADDDPVQLEYLSALVRRLRPEWEITGELTSADQLQRELSNPTASLAILDVRFAGTTSIEIVTGLRESFPVIFVTGDAQFAAEAFTAEAVDFVLKPIRAERFEQALRKAEAQLAHASTGGPKPHSANSLRMFRGQELVWAQLNEVWYFEANRKYTRVVMKNHEGLLKMGISSAVRFLDPDSFWRIHRGLVLNVAHMASAKRDELGRLTVKLAGRDEKLIVSRPYEKLFRDGFS